MRIDLLQKEYLIAGTFNSKLNSSTMKIKKSFLSTILLLSFVVASCDQGVAPSSNEKIDQVELEPEVALSNFGDTFNEVKPLFQNLTEHVKLKKEKKGKQVEKALSSKQIADGIKMLDHLSGPALAFFNSLGFTQKDYKKAFGTSNRSVIGRKAAGFALIIYKLRSCQKNDINTPFSNNIVMSDEKPKWVTCALEATGLAAGAAVIGGLGYGTLSEKGKKALLKSVAKIGGRTLSGIGLALVAAEFTWCMLR